MTQDEAPPETETRQDATDPEQSAGGPAGGVPPSVEIVEAVSDATGRDPTELPPLQESVDADAVDSLLATGSGDDGAGIYLEFEYHDVDVTVRRDGSIEVDP